MNKFKNTVHTPFIIVAINTANLISKPKKINNNEQNTTEIVCESEKQVVNEITGRIWVIGGISLSIFLTIIRPVHSPLLIIALYLLTIVVSFLITFVMIKMKKSKDKQSIK